MKDFPAKITAAGICLVLLLSACQVVPVTPPPLSGDSTPVPSQVEPVATNTTVPADTAAPATANTPTPTEPLVVTKARKDLARQLAISIDDITLYHYSAVDWPDSCLGVYTSKKMCAEVITPGYIIQLTARGLHYSLHTNADASVVLLAAQLPVDPPPTGDLPLDEARAILVGFFRLLNEGNYAEAAPSYGGAVDILIQNNPDVDPKDLPALLERACLQNGHVCLPVREVLHSQAVRTGEYRFVVTFTHPDGSLFQRGPCCGDDSALPQAEFEYIVKLVDGKYLVMDLPPYVP
jgi:hypothetical protein